MKETLTLKKSAVIAAVCMALCISVYGAPTPEQVRERTQMLLQAVENDDVERARLCIKLGADVKVNETIQWDTGYRGVIFFTLLSYAVMQENKDMLELLIESGADVDAKGGYTGDGDTALMIAVQSGNKEITELLIKTGADVNVKTLGDRTALMYAARNGNKDMVELLIKAGVDVNAKDNEGWTALMKAANKDVAGLLVKAGSDGNAALVWAVKEGYDGKVKSLIEAGVDVNAKDSDGISVLTYAILYGKSDIADMLRAAGAKE